MTENQIFNLIMLISSICAVATFIILFFISAPYGRHTRKGWGVLIPNYLSWLLMEAPSPLIMLLLFIIGTAPKNFILYFFLCMWLAHYIHRSFIYPFMLSNGKKKMPISMLGMALLFNTGNAYLNGRYLFTFSGGYNNRWMLDPRFITGLILFLGGFILNRWADEKLRLLREPGETGYKIPYGGLYQYVSCPNYFGEIIEWLGWALMTWSLPGLLFSLWTISNLAPRAHSHHRWYHENFPDYPNERKALVPFCW